MHVKVYAGDPSTLSAEAATGRVQALARQSVERRYQHRGTGSRSKL